MEEFIKPAIAAVESAARILKKDFGRISERSTKNGNPKNLVTKTDQAAEKAMVDVLSASFPNHRILGEETGLHGPETASYQWLLDPLDGTSNFSQGLPFFATSLALQQDDRVILSIINDPIHQELFQATLYDGAELNHLPIRVSDVGNSDLAFLAIAWGRQAKMAPQIGQLSQRFLKARILGTGALSFAYLAAGRIDCFIESDLPKDAIWDLEPGKFLAESAGAKVVKLDNFGPNDYLAANPKLLTVTKRLIDQL